MRIFAVVVSFTLALWSASADAESVVRYGISLADIPLPRGQPDRGAGAYQFTGYTIYDPLVAWEMNVADRPGKPVPGRSARPTPVVVVVTSETLKLRPPDVAAVLDEIAKKPTMKAVSSGGLARRTPA